MTILGNAVEGMAGGFRTLLLYLHALWLSQSATSQVCLTVASFSTAQHLSGCFFFFKTSFGKTDVTECWNQLLACGTPFKYSPLSPLGRLEIQMIYLSIICYRGCVLQPKPGTMNFRQGFIYNNPTHKHTSGPHWGCCQGLVFRPRRICLGQPYWLLAAFCVWKLVTLRKHKSLHVPWRQTPASGHPAS